jgi:hypothetical protein
MFISHVHENLRSRSTESFSIMSLINGMVCAQIFTIHRLIKLWDVLGGDAIY